MVLVEDVTEDVTVVYRGYRNVNGAMKGAIMCCGWGYGIEENWSRAGPER